MSALRQTAGRSTVLEWATVTVAFSLIIIMAIGFPTILLLPTITHSLPSVSIPLLLMSSMIPAGVQDLKPGRPMLSAPTLWGWKPSTSFKGEIARITSLASSPFGRGSCTRIPLIEGSSFSSRTLERSSSCVVSAGIAILTEAIPVYSHAFCLLRTYTVLAGSSPTCTTASVSRMPFSSRIRVSSLTSSLICFEISLPSMIFVIVYLRAVLTFLPGTVQKSAYPSGPFSPLFRFLH